MNRYWQQYFGTGLVRTSEDFGKRGERPSHPALLDWLAVEFVESGWDAKHVHRLIVTSSTYRQSSRQAPTTAARDPENRLLSRGPRLALRAETVRDHALRVAGLLNHRIGGRSVYPYQPPGLWKEVSYNPNDYTAQTYQPSHGGDLYRRGLYTFWKRTVLSPSLESFGAPNRETCVSRRFASITPMQTLTIMNDPTYVEASRAFAQRILQEGGDEFETRITYAMRVALCRDPNAAERSLFKDLLTAALQRFDEHEKAAEQLLSVGESPRDTTLDLVEHASWTTLTNVIFTLDEALSDG